VNVATPLVLTDGSEGRLPPGKDGHPIHTLPVVYGAMLMQVMREYSGLGDFRRLSLAEIRFLYGGLRRELKESARLAAKAKAKHGK